MAETDKQKFDYQLLGRVLAQAKPYRLLFVSTILLTIVLAPIGILRPYLIQYTVDHYILRPDLQGLQMMVVILLLVLVLESILRYIFTYASNALGQNIIRDLRVRVFDHIIGLRLRYFDRTPIGQSTTRTINDIETINNIFGEGIITIISDMLSLIVVLAVMFWTSWQLTLVCLITMPLLIVATYIFKEKVKVSFQKVRTEIAKMNAFVQERITGMKTVQIFNAEEKELEQFQQINKRHTDANMDSILYYSIFFPVVEILSAAALGLMVWYGAKGAIGNEVTIGVLVAFPLYLGMLFRPVRMLADKFNTLQMGLVAAEKVFGILDNNDKTENKGTLVPKHIKGDIRFQNVVFSYDGEHLILKDLSFHVKSGEKLALVGSTGSGKTTIINIIGRFYDIQSGSILIDQRDVRDYELHALRSRIAIVLQDVFLFSGSVLENITLRDSSISREKVAEVAKMIGAHPFIERLPGGYDYEVMERGATLSMGQRQLISFVRALVFEPDILILDEATSSIDTETEAVIQYAIEKMIAQRTSIIIAHRLSTIRNADNILVLEKGEMKEFGPHEQLLKIEGGHYRKLYDMQFETVG
jgi:ATP-binding cassette subfamily B multidrug efflux pump